MEEIKKGNTYEAVVKGIAAGGLIVEIAGTRITSLVTVKELAYPFGKQSHLFQFKPGNKVRVRVIDILKDHHVVGKQDGVRYVLSIRLAENDPWTDINNTLNWKPGSKKPYSIQVERMTAEYAKGEVIPGVTAIVSLKDLSRFFDLRRSTIKTNMDLQPKIGDFLAGFIKEINSGERIVALDVVSYIKNIKKQIDLIQIKEIEPQNTGALPETITYYSTYVNHTIQNILIVDNETDFCESLSELLAGEGYHVFTALDTIQASTILAEEVIHLVLLDVQVPSQEECFELMDNLAKNHKGIKIILTTGDDNFPSGRDTKAIDHIPISNFLLKPFSINELKEAVAGINNNPPIPFKDFFHFEKPESVPSADSDIDLLLADTFTSPTTKVQILFNKIVKETRAGAGAIFEIHPLTLEVFMPYSENISITQFNKLRERLAMSPVRDCAIDKEYIYSNTAHHEEEQGKHHYLVELADYTSVIMVPILTRDEFCRCLFLCNRGMVFTLEDRHKAEKTGVEFSKIYTEESHLKKAILEKTEATTGLNFAVLGHELKSKLVVMEAMIENLKTKVTREVNLDRQALLYDLAHLEKTNKRVLDITTLFRGLGVKESAAMIKVEELIKKVVEDVEKYAVEELYHIKIHLTDIPFPLPPVYMKEKELYQLFFNLLLNAVQHSALFLAPVLIHISIQLEFVKDNNREAIAIDFRDWGPGIHTKDFDRIFEPMFTTRKDGAGLGLYVCKRLLTESGGDLFVYKSHLYTGTTFRVLLPVKGTANAKL